MSQNWQLYKPQLERRNILPPRVGLYRVIFRRYAWYFTVETVVSVIVSYDSHSRHPIPHPPNQSHRKKQV